MKRSAGTMSSALFACMLAAVLVSGRAAGDPYDHVRFEASGNALAMPKSGPLELEIDTPLNIRWEREALLLDIARREQLVDRGDSLLPEIEKLQAAAVLLFETQRKLVALQATVLRLRRLDPGATLTGQPDFDQANRELSEVGVRALGMLRPYRQSDPSLYAALGQAVLSPSGYEPMAQLVEARLREWGDELARRMDSATRIEIYMLAKRIDVTGHVEEIHLEGYDELVAGDPAPFARFETTAGPRTIAELQAAQKFGAVVDQLAKASLAKELKDAFAELGKSAGKLAETLEFEVLIPELDSLRTGLASAAGDQALPVVALIQDIRASVMNLAQTPSLEGETDADRLVSLSRETDGFVRNLRSIANELPGRLETLSARATELIAGRPNRVIESSIEKVRAEARHLRSEGSGTKALVELSDKIRSAVGVMAGVQNAASEASARPRRVAPGQSLDTRLDPLTIAGRHPGDLIVLTTRVTRQDPGAKQSVIVAEQRQTIRLEAYGPYLESRGALLFVDPRKGGLNAQSYEASPGLGFYWKYGLKNHPTWNRVLTPGIGASFTLLDFVDNRDLELGIAAGATMLADIVWIGYGRNLQAHADYFYIGINPLTLYSVGRGQFGTR